MTELTVAAAADFHGRLPDPWWMPETDILVLAGDLSNGSRDDGWWERTMAPWLEAMHIRHPKMEIVGTAGNFDPIALDPRGRDYLRSLDWTFLHDEGIVLPRSQVRVHGSPWAMPHGSWPFCEPDDVLAERWKLIHPDTEILITHGPPKGVMDKVAIPSRDDTDQDGHVGSPSLRDKITELADRRLRAAVWGHIHEARGMREIPDLTLVNASCFYDDPFVFTITPCES